MCHIYLSLLDLKGEPLPLLVFPLTPRRLKKRLDAHHQRGAPVQHDAAVIVHF